MLFDVILGQAIDIDRGTATAPTRTPLPADGGLFEIPPMPTGHVIRRALRRLDAEQIPGQLAIEV